jgi:hypothetical protein
MYAIGNRIIPAGIAREPSMNILVSNVLEISRAAVNNPVIIGKYL